MSEFIPDLYDEQVQEGISWTLRQVGKALSASEWTEGDGTETVEGDVHVEIHNILVAAGLCCPETSTMATLAAQPSAGAQGEVSDEWAERFCEAVNWSPDGQECKAVEGEMRCTTFREIAKGHILAVIATDPHPTPAQPSAAVLQAVASFQAVSKCASGEPIKGLHQRFQAMEVSDAIDIALGELLDALKMPAQADTSLQEMQTSPQPDTGDVAALREALEPFIDAMKVIRPDDHDTSKICLATVADYRRLAAAYAALAAAQPQSNGE